MIGLRRRARVLAGAGLAALVIGTLDPLEGSVVILFGIGVLALESWWHATRYRGPLYSALALTAVGVAALWGLSAIGGFGGRTGRSSWWGLALLPYPIGWLIGLVSGVRRVREVFRTAA